MAWWRKIDGFSMPESLGITLNYQVKPRDNVRILLPFYCYIPENPSISCNLVLLRPSCL